MKQNKNSWIIVCGVSLICLLGGCKSTNVPTSGAAILKTEEVFFSSVLDHSFRFQTLSARMRLDFSDRELDFSARVQLKIIRDDRIQLSVQPLGIELFRIEITHDSIKMLDRRNKQYVAERYDTWKDKMQVEFNFHNLQALLTNQLFVPGETNISNRHFRRFRMTKEYDRALLKLEDAQGWQYTFTAGGRGDNEQLLSTAIEDKRRNRQLTWDYQQFQKSGAQLFPMKMTARLSTDENRQVKAVLNFSSPEIDRPLNMDFRIPPGYKRVRLEQIIKSLERR
jgi:hypothetical protein